MKVCWRLFGMLVSVALASIAAWFTRPSDSFGLALLLTGVLFMSAGVAVFVETRTAR